MRDTASFNSCTFSKGVLHMLNNFGNCCIIDERALICVLIQPISNDQ